MSNVSYVYGTIEDVVFEVEALSPVTTFVAADWTAEVALCELGQHFDKTTATWETATLEVVGTKVYAVAPLVGTLDPDVGDYSGRVRLTKTGGGPETPIIKPEGIITISNE